MSQRYNPKDHFFKKAKAENYSARSVYKLEEIDIKHRLLKPGSLVLDLGAAPGSWSEYCAKRVGHGGKVLGVDLTSITTQLPNVCFVQADVLSPDFESFIAANGFSQGFDVVLSDMAPKTTGVKLTDHARSLELCEMALTLAQTHLRKGGHFVCKLFQSQDQAAFQKKMNGVFTQVQVSKPKATRSRSQEIFLVGLGKKD